MGKNYGGQRAGSAACFGGAHGQRESLGDGMYSSGQVGIAAATSRGIERSPLVVLFPAGRN